MTQREAFDAFQKRRNPKYHPSDDGVSDRLDWELWQAAQAQAAVKESLTTAEPVAFGMQSSDGGIYYVISATEHTDGDGCEIPLYTAPPDHTALLDRIASYLWVVTEHNALHHGNTHNTVEQGRSLLAEIRKVLP